ncbi:unnamed protein product, partial [Arctogadus glacialis]
MYTHKPPPTHRQKNGTMNKTLFQLMWFRQGNRAPICPSSPPLAEVMQAIMGQGANCVAVCVSVCVCVC